MRPLRFLADSSRSVRATIARIACTLGTASVLGCGGAEAPPDSPSRPTESADPAPPPMSEAQKKLQGTWEIVRYESARPIPKEAMPVMGEMFDALRLHFEGASATFQIGKTSEKLVYDVADESGSEFRLVAKGGMFDGAACKFVSDDQWEV